VSNQSQVKIAFIGAGSRSFAPSTLSNLLSSEALREFGLHLCLMDIVDHHLQEVATLTNRINENLGRGAKVSTTTELKEALEGADYVIIAVEVDRYKYWSQDFHVPRWYGFDQPYAENGGPGGIFHALRNMTPLLEVARAMEEICPDAPLFNYTNPEHKLCEAVNRLTNIEVYGLCPGAISAARRMTELLGMPAGTLEAYACGMNHFSWFQVLRDRRTGEDLYPKLREMDRKGDWLSHWHQFGLGRILMRRFGLWPVPWAANHYAEYLRWGSEFVAHELQYFYDPADGHPWETGNIPEFIYNLEGNVTDRPLVGPPTEPNWLDDSPIKETGMQAVTMIEAMATGERRELASVNVPNRGAIPGIQDDMVVEIPAVLTGRKFERRQMEALPEPVTATIRLYGSIHKLVVEAYAEQSKEKLMQAVLLEPTVDSYRRAVSMVDHMLELQRDMLPSFS